MRVFIHKVGDRQGLWLKWEKQEYVLCAQIQKVFIALMDASFLVIFQYYWSVGKLAFWDRCDSASEGLLCVRAGSVSVRPQWDDIIKPSAFIDNKQQNASRVRTVVALDSQAGGLSYCQMASCIWRSVTQDFFLESMPCTLCHRQLEKKQVLALSVEQLASILENMDSMCVRGGCIFLLVSKGPRNICHHLDLSSYEKCVFSVLHEFCQLFSPLVLSEKLFVII